MQVVVEDSTNAHERASLIEGWNKLDPPTPIDISAVTLRVINNGGTPANADGTTTRLDASHVHRFVFANAAQFQSFAAGDVVALIVPDSATGDGRMGLSFPILVSAGNPGAASQDVPTAEENAAAVVAEAPNIASAVVEAEIDALETYNRTSNTAATITGPTSGSNALTITTDVAYEPIKSIT